MGFCSVCGNWVDEGEICGHCGSSGGNYEEEEEEDDDYDNEFSNHTSRAEYFIRRGKTCSIKGDHETAIKFYEEAMNNLGSKEILTYIADEYVAMGNYSAGLHCWNEFCPDGVDDIINLYKKGKFLKRIGKYDDAIKIHKKQLTKVESKIDLDKNFVDHKNINWYFKFINEIIDSYDSWGKYDLADNYRKIRNQKIDVLVDDLFIRAEKELEKEDSHSFTAKDFYRDALRLDPDNDDLKRTIVYNYSIYAERAMKNGQFFHAAQYYKFASELDPNNNELKRKFEESDRIYQEDKQSNGKLSREAKRKKEREEQEKKHEQWEKEYEEYRKRKEEYEKEDEYLKNSYFKHIQKARDFAAENNFSKAIKEYQKAIENHDEFFQSDFLNLEMKRNVPEKSLTPEDVDHIMMIYRKTHPLLISNGHSQKINAQIIDLLGGEWDERLTEVDRQAGQILEQRKLERQKKIENAEDIAVDVIVGARIVGNSIFKRLKR